MLDIDGGTFEAYSTSWPFIYLLNSGADGSFIKNATINDATYGIHTNNADNLTFDGVTVSDATYAGLKVVSSQGVTVEDCTFQDATYDGIYIDASDVVILDSRADGNGNKGIAVLGNSNADFGLQNEDHPSVITDNYRGIHVYGNSFATLGDRTVNGNYFSMSSTYNNTTYNAKTGSGTLIAEETWWGSDPPDLNKMEESGVIIYADWLTSPVVTRVASAPGADEADALPVAEEALSLRRQAEGSSGAPAHAFMLDADTETMTRPEMVQHLRRMLSRDKARAVALLDQLRRDGRSPHQRLARLLYVQHLAGEGQLVAANALGATLLRRADLSAYDREFVLQQLFYANLYAGHKAEATRLLGELTALGAEDAENGLLALVFETETGHAPLLIINKQAASPSAQEPEARLGLDNYPNPFNPSTEIRFTLPAASAVSLVVYDVTGREVATLVDRQIGVGEHRVTWDASHLPSGTYLYRLTAGDVIQTKSMVLMK